MLRKPEKLVVYLTENFYFFSFYFGAHKSANEKNISFPHILYDRFRFKSPGETRNNPSLLNNYWPAFWIGCPNVSARDYGVFISVKSLN